MLTKLARATYSSRKPRRRLRLENLEPRQLLAGNPVISEFMASNDNTLDDGDGNSSDWIEIYNAGDAPADLAGWYLTDDAALPTKWPFPSYTLAAGEQLLVFASGQAVDDYVDPAGFLHANFQLSSGGEYLALVRDDGVNPATIATEFAPEYPAQKTDRSYGVAQDASYATLIESTSAAKMLVPTADVGTDWRADPAVVTFDDSAWQTVNAGIGFEPVDGPVSVLANVALGATVTASGATGGHGGGSLLTDGSVALVSHPAIGATLGFYYQIDLAETVAMEEIKLYNRTGCCPERLSNYQVDVLDESQTIVWTAGIRTDGTNSGDGGIDLVTAGLDAAGTFEGRYVRITNLSGNEYNPQIAEVEVMAWPNLALNKPASGSFYGGGYPASNGVDGNVGNFTHTGNSGPVYWEVDLEGTFDLGRIEVVNRADCCGERLDLAVLTVLDAARNVIFTAPPFVDANVGQTFVLDNDDRGFEDARFIRIDQNDQYLSIAELRAFAPPAYIDMVGDPAEVPIVEAALLNVNTSAYLRVPFTVADTSLLDRLSLAMRTDDGFVAYLNGIEVARVNAPAGDPTYNAAATAEHVGWQMLDFDVPVGLLDDGENLLAMQGLNRALADDDFLLVPRLDVRSTPMGGFGYFSTPTPGDVNGNETVTGFVKDTTFDVGRGFFEAADLLPGGVLESGVTITTATPGATVVYTLDGSAPGETNGTQVPPADENTPPVANVPITTTTTLRAAAIKAGLEPTNVDTQTYIFLADVIRQATGPAGEALIPDGLPSDWRDSGGTTAGDYQMDPEVVDDPAYADEIIEGLRSIPTISIVMDPADLWSTESGIYMNSNSRGSAWERATSVEIIEPDGTSFQADSGIRIHGYSWRRHNTSPKHGFRLEFRPEYGPSKLEYPLFPDAPVDKFDSIVLRQQGGRAWAGFQVPVQAQYLRDTFARDLAREMGAVDGHATLVHLYLNGLYWGLYNPVERPNAQMGEEYFGGSDEDYDALNRRTSTNEVIDGDMVRYNEMLAIVNNALAAGVTTDEDYTALQSYLAMDDFIDFMLRSQYVTNRDGVSSYDGNNQRAIGNRVNEDAQFRFFVWDMEYSLWNATDNAHIGPGLNSPPLPGSQDPANGVWAIYKALVQHPEFRLRYGDHVQEHMFNGGALTPEAAAATWEVRAESIETAIIGESARWGDSKRDVPYTRDVEWQAERNRLLTTYFPDRTDVLVGQLTGFGLYPSLGAPVFSQHGGQIPAGYELSVEAPAGTVYFTTDGTDPRVEGGAVADDVGAVRPSIALVTADSPAKVLVPPGPVDSGWTGADPAFDDTGWLDATGPIGFDTTPSYAPIDVPLQNATADRSQTLANGNYNGVVGNAIDGNSGTGWTLAITGEGTLASTAVFETQQDVGFAEGTQLTFTLAHTALNAHNLGKFRISATTSGRDTFADGLDNGGDVADDADTDWIPLTPLIAVGNNGTTLTIQPDDSVLVSGGANTQETYTITAVTDLAGITGFRLEALEDPALPDNGPGRQPVNGNASVSQFSVQAGRAPAAVPLQNATADRSQTIANGSFDLVVGYAIDDDPVSGWGLGADGQYIDSTAVFETVDDFGFADGTQLTFTLTHTSPYANHNLGNFRLSVTADDRDTFADGLAGGGDVDATWIEVTPISATANSGATLTIRDDNTVLASGSVGQRETYTVVATTNLTNITGVRIEAIKDPSLPGGGPGTPIFNGNAVLTNFVVQATPLSLGGVFDPVQASQIESAMLGQNASALVRFPFTIGSLDDLTELALSVQHEDGFVAYLNGTEVARDNVTGTPAWNAAADANRNKALAIDAQQIDLTGNLGLLNVGENVLAIQVLNDAPGSGDLLVAAQLAAAGQASIVLNESTTIRARTFDGNQWSALVEAQFVVNPAASGNLAVSEIHYNPLPPTQAERDALVDTVPELNGDDFEYIELRNTSDEAISLAGVSFVAGSPIEFAFDGPDPAILEPGQSGLLVSNMAAFTERFGTQAASAVLGQFVTGRIANNGEWFRLLDAAGAPIQEFRFNDRSPWPEAADGLGASLQLIAPASNPDHADPANWTAAAPTPGDVLGTMAVGRHVFYNNSTLDDGTSAAAPADDAAIAPDKTPLLPGQAASFANYTNFDRGITGVMVDVASLGADPTTADFIFRAGRGADRTSWLAAPDPADVVVRRGAGVGGSDRVSIVWDDNQIVGQWLEVTLKGNTPAGLPADDVFAFGNAPGETGNDIFALGALVNAADVIAIRDNPRGPANPASLDDPHDVNRDLRVDAVDLILARDRATSPLTALGLPFD